MTMVKVSKKFVFKVEAALNNFYNEYENEKLRHLKARHDALSKKRRYLVFSKYPDLPEPTLENFKELMYIENTPLHPDLYEMQKVGTKLQTIHRIANKASKLVEFSLVFPKEEVELVTHWAEHHDKPKDSGQDK